MSALFSTTLDSLLTHTTETSRFVWIGGATAVVLVVSFQPSRKVLFKFVNGIASKLLTAVGFVWSVLHDTVWSRDRSLKITEWNKVMNSVQDFLNQSGLQEEWSRVLNSENLIGNLFVIGDIQELVDPGRDRICLEEQETYASETTLKAAQHWMRYATAVYGIEFMVSAELEVLDGTLHAPSDSIEKCIVQHILQVNESAVSKLPSPLVEVTYSELDAGESREGLRFLVAIDHQYKRVVLAIRGTLSLSGAIVDITGFSQEFCGGQAHSGIARMAQKTWSRAESHVCSAFDKSPADYGLLVTGHSLGAGCACLINIQLHYNISLGKLSYLEKRVVESVVFAPPPVYFPPTAAEEAITNSVAFCHNKDVVPSLSVDAIRRFLQLADDIDQAYKHISFVSKLRARLMSLRPPERLIRIVRDSYGRKLDPLDGAPQLTIPARALIWMQDCLEKDGTIKLKELNCKRYADRVFDLHDRMISDHMTTPYQLAFSQLLKSL